VKLFRSFGEGKGRRGRRANITEDNYHYFSPDRWCRCVPKGDEFIPNPAGGNVLCGKCGVAWGGKNEQRQLQEDDADAERVEKILHELSLVDLWNLREGLQGNIVWEHPDLNPPGWSTIERLHRIWHVEQVWRARLDRCREAEEKGERGVEALDRGNQLAEYEYRRGGQTGRNEISKIRATPTKKNGQ